MTKNDTKKRTDAGIKALVRQLLEALSGTIDIYGNEIVIEAPPTTVVVCVSGDIHIHGSCRHCSEGKKQ